MEVGGVRNAARHTMSYFGESSSSDSSGSKIVRVADLLG